MNKTKATTNNNKNELNKLLILEEADGLPRATQILLRKYIKDKQNKTTYILTCNDINDLSKKLQLNFHRIAFKKLKKKGLVKNFMYVLNQEKVRYELKTLKKIADYSDGDMRIGLNYLHSISNIYNEINEDYFFRILNVKNPVYDKKIIETCLKKEFKQVFKILDDIIEEGYSYYQIKMFYNECIIRLKYVILKVSDVLRDKLHRQIQVEKRNNYDSISQIYGFFANIMTLIKKYYK